MPWTKNKNKKIQTSYYDQRDRTWTQQTDIVLVISHDRFMYYSSRGSFGNIKWGISTELFLFYFFQYFNKNMMTVVSFLFIFIHF